MPQRIVRDPRYSFVVLVILSCVLAFAAVMASLKAIHDNNQKWCQVVNTIVSIPAPKPANPSADPKGERSYKFYIEFVDLQRSLGCEDHI